MAGQDDIDFRPGVTYATHDGVELKGDLYLPKGDGPFPALVTCPGGGFRVCDSAGHKQWGFYLAARGYAVFTVTYRVTAGGKKVFPEAVNDVLAGIQFVRGNAKDFKIDPARIGLLGTSAGANLAALGALANDYHTFKNAYPNDAFANVSTDVKCLIPVYGPFDMFKHWQRQLQLNPERNNSEVYLGKSPFEDPKLYHDASPIRHVKFSKNKMPVMLIWGHLDDAVNPEQSANFMDVLKQARFQVTALQLPHAAHFWWGREQISEPTSSCAIVAPRLMHFLKTSL